MQAYPIAYNKEKKLIRIYDMTPSAKVKVFDYPYDVVYKALRDNKIKLDRTRVFGSSIIYGELKMQYLPDWEDAKDRNKLFVIGYISRGNGQTNVLFVDVNGNDIELSIDELEKIPRNELVNCYIPYSNTDGVLTSSNDLIKVVYSQGGEVPTLGLNILDLKNIATNEVVIPSNIDGVINTREDMTLKIESRVEISSKFFFPYPGDGNAITLAKVEFLGNVDRILYGGISGKHVKTKWVLPNKGKFIGLSSLNNIDMNIINLYNYEETQLRNGALGQSSASLLILPKSLEILWGGAMAGAKISMAYFPPSIRSIPNTIIQEWESLNTAIVVRGSIAHKFFARRKRIQVIDFTTEQEALEYLAPRIEELNKDNATAVDRFLMAFGNSDDPIIKEIMSPEYISKANLYMKVYQRIRGNTSSQDISIPLKTDKLKLPGLYARDFGNDALKEVLDIIPVQKEDSLNTLSNEFKLICNYITDNSEPMNILLTKENSSGIARISEEELREIKCKSLDAEILYGDGNSAILSNTLTFDRSIIPGMSVAKTVILVIANRIVYMAICERIDTGHITRLIDKALPDDTIDTDIDMTGLIKPGDQLSSGITSLGLILNSIRMPLLLSSIFYKKLNRQLLVADIRYNPDKRGVGTIRYLSLKSGTLLECQFEHGYGHMSPSQFTLERLTYNNLVVKKKYEYGKYPANVANSMKYKFFSDKSTTDMVIGAIVKDSLVAGLMDRPDAYDNLEPCYEWKLSKLLIENGVTDLSKINGKLLKAILDTAYFYKTTARAVTNIRKGVPSDKAQLAFSDGTEVYMYVLDSRDKLLPMVGVRPRRVYRVSSPYKDVDGKYYYCESDIQTVLNQLLKIYNPEAKELGYLTDSSIHGYCDKSDLHIIYNGQGDVMDYEDTGSPIRLVISRNNGQIYLVTNFASQSNMRLLFRLKNNLQRSMETQYYMAWPKRGVEYIDLCYYSTTIYNEKGEYDSRNQLIRLRESIMSGVPNGYIPNINLGKYIKYFANQPKWAKDNPLGKMGTETTH